MYIKACHADSPGGVILHLLPVPQNWEFTLVLSNSRYSYGTSTLCTFGCGGTKSKLGTSSRFDGCLTGNNKFLQ